MAERMNSGGGKRRRRRRITQRETGILAGVS
jgi:hypothetical protein